jgi:hypothetical protein
MIADSGYDRKETGFRASPGALRARMGALSFQKVSGSIARRRQIKKSSLALSGDRGKSGILIRN